MEGKVFGCVPRKTAQLSNYLNQKMTNQLKQIQTIVKTPDEIFEGTEDGMTRILKLPSRRNEISLIISPMFGVHEVPNNSTISGKYSSRSTKNRREQSTH